MAWVEPWYGSVPGEGGDRFGATAVQLVEKRGGVCKILEHLGSAHTEAELAALMLIGWPPAVGAVVEGTSSRLLVDVIRGAWELFGSDVMTDEAFFQYLVAELSIPGETSNMLRRRGH